MSHRITYQNSPGFFSFYIAIVVVMLITGFLVVPLGESGQMGLFLPILALDIILAVVVGLLNAWRKGTLFPPKKAPPPGPPPQGVDELQAIRAAGPMQCPYCETSLLPSMATCPKCGRRIF